MTRWRPPPFLVSVWRLARSSGAVEVAARFGYASRGAVYLSVGGMALAKAIGLAPHAQGAVGALEAWAQWPLGVALLWITAVGLCGFAGWRALQSVFDVEHLGRGLKALATRAGKAVSGLLYGVLGVTVLNLLDTLRDLRRDDDEADTVAFVQHALTLPFGRTLVMVFGAVLLGVGLGNMVRAFVDHFAGDLQCHDRWRGLIGWTARIGYFARGAAFLPAGVFTILAGWRSQPHTAVSISRSLDYFQSLPFGTALLAVQALGLAAFGVFGLTKAAFRRVDLVDGPATDV
jgi:hypothetical protein